jgi:hypothetical protein
MTGKVAGSPAYRRHVGDRERSQEPAGPGQRKETSDTGHWPGPATLAVQGLNDS